VDAADQSSKKTFLNIFLNDKASTSVAGGLTQKKTNNQILKR